MKNKIFSLSILILLVFSVILPLNNVSAASSGASSRFHWFSVLRERIASFFTFNSQKKVEKAVSSLDKEKLEIKTADFIDTSVKKNEVEINKKTEDIKPVVKKTESSVIKKSVEVQPQLSISYINFP